MSFPPYPEYKDSGVAWLGEVPAHWRLSKLKHLACFSGGGTPSRENMSYWGGDNPWVSPKDMKVENIVEAEESITAEGLENSTTNLLPAGQVLMVVRSGILKHTIPVAINQVSVALNQDMKALTFRPEECLSRFFLRWVQGLNNELLLAWAKQGATVESIEHAYLAETRLPLPSIEEQHAIADFLDRETAKIDTLVAEQERLIALLKEKRQAVISHAVTKGLDPNVPMKDSGIEWLGEVPGHWGVTQIKRIGSIRYGIGEPPRYQADGIPLIRATNVHAGKLLLEDGLVFVDPSEIPENRIVWLEAGDIIVVRSGAYTGDSAIIPEDAPPYIAGFDMVLRCHAISPKYFQFALLSSYLKEGQIDLERMRAAQPHLNAEELGACTVLKPPAEEQTAIAAFLGRETARVDALIAEAEKGITLLKERRSALIAAAVTGKIDVRGVATLEAAA